MTRLPLLAVTVALAFAAGPAQAQLTPGRSNGPLGLTADASDYSQDKCQSQWRGRVEATQDQTRLRADLIDVYFHRNGPKTCTGDFERLEANGNIFYVTQKGQVGVIDPDTGAIKTMQFPAGEGIYNSISGDESGAIYVVTDHKLYAVGIDGAGQPQIRWQAAYDRGTKKKSGQLSQGSGTTVTVIGDDLVAITDNAEPRMNVLQLNPAPFPRRTRE